MCWRQGVLNGTMNVYILKLPFFGKGFKSLQLMAPKEITSIPKSVHVNQNGNGRIVLQI